MQRRSRLEIESGGVGSCPKCKSKLSSVCAQNTPSGPSSANRDVTVDAVACYTTIRSSSLLFVDGKKPQKLAHTKPQNRDETETRRDMRTLSLTVVLSPSAMTASTSTMYARPRALRGSGLGCLNTLPYLTFPSFTACPAFHPAFVVLALSDDASDHNPSAATPLPSPTVPTATASLRLPCAPLCRCCVSLSNFSDASVLRYL